MYSGYRGFRGQRTYYETSIDKDADEQLKFYRYSANWVVFSWFVGFALVVFGAYKTFITLDSIFHFFVISGGVATGAHYYLTPNRQPKMLPAIAFYNYLGIGGLVTGLFLMLNMGLSGPEQKTTVRIDAINESYAPGSLMDGNSVKLDQAELDQFKYVIDFQQWKWSEFRSANALEITYRKGFFGYRVYQRARLVKE
jgi:hypothetical protein